MFLYFAFLVDLLSIQGPLTKYMLDQYNTILHEYDSMMALISSKEINVSTSFNMSIIFKSRNVGAGFYIFSNNI